MELNSIEFALFFGILIGWNLSSLYRHYRDEQLIKLVVNKIKRDEENIMDKRIADEILATPFCYVEKYDKNDYILYNSATDAFVCQGKSYEELAELCKTRFHTVIVKADDKSMWFVDGKVLDEDLIQKELSPD
jgi:hypothetical protein